MKAIWAAAALLIGLGLLAAYAVTRPRDVWSFHFQTLDGAFLVVEFPKGAAPEELPPLLRKAIERCLPDAGTPDRVVDFTWATVRTTRSWVPSWPPLRTDHRRGTIGKIVVDERSDGQWEVASDGRSAASGFPTLEQAVDEALRRLRPPD